MGKGVHRLCGGSIPKLAWVMPYFYRFFADFRKAERTDVNMILPRARRKPGEEQPYISLGLFKLRLPFIHWEWEVSEMIQALLVFVTGTAAITYLQDLFGLSFEVALSIVVVHEALYLLNNLLGDPLVGGWITPALPLIIIYLLQHNGTDRIWALLSLELILASMFIFLGLTGLAEKLVNRCPRSLKAGILVGSSFAACLGKYGFMSLAQGGAGFWANPISFSIGVLLALYLMFSYSFGKLKFTSKLKIVRVLSKAGFVPALLIASIVGMIVGEIGLPSLDFSHIFFNPFPGLKWVSQNFSLLGVGLPPLHILVSAFPIAIACYLIAFGDIVNGTVIIKEAQTYRQDEKIDMNPNRTNVCCGIRNLIECFFSPTLTMSGPTWTAMTITVAERYKSGEKNMYSIFGGVCTFNATKVFCHLIVPFVAIVKPVLPLAMELTWMIQAFGCFYIGMNMCRTNVERGVAGLTGGAIAVCANPSIGLLIGIILCVVMEFAGTSKADRAAQVVSGLATTVQTNFSNTEE